MQLIPAIDLRDGRCVRLRQGDFAAETRYPDDPLELLQRYRDLGARWLHVVDLDGARDGVRANQATIARLAAAGGIALQVGGGVRTRQAVDELLALGVGRVVVGSAAVEAPEDVAGWLAACGAERLCLAFDVRCDAGGTPMLRTRGWQRDGACSLWAGIERYAGTGLRHVLCTDIERDGALGGPHLGLYRTAAQRHPQLRWQASGGIATIDDLHALAATGAAAAISGTALLEGRLPPEALQPFLRAA
ncbi:MAG TPA: 1-(5-phosphoribosyl)-5-[(5-phosphoribosylamino)methylideneamino] imidazole-4-carboxamide isomerase [Steroidobacteraceae bacterium]|nr:1-(5-phosphoribosyl)-5-[(5-phosphoribosylamino)methylideneamino] imidazole-4-carboxamide isomerase [Steroidobacteraceae bacterium]